MESCGFRAEIGKKLWRMFDTDENGKYLGEVALVHMNHNFQIKRHIIKNIVRRKRILSPCIRSTYPTCVEGGVDMNEDELKENGINDSLIHVDFMVGSKDMRIVGTTSDGQEVEVFKEEAGYI